jgi:hypothetical protein
MGMPQMQPQPTGFGGGGGLQPPTMQPLVPQKTGPPPPVRFGVSEAQKKLAPQATGRRANLAAASELFFFSFSPPFSVYWCWCCVSVLLWRGPLLSESLRKKGLVDNRIAC